MDRDQAHVLVDSPLRILADWYLADREGENLQPGTLEFYRYRIRYLIETFGQWKAKDVSTAHLRSLLLHLKEARSWSAQNTNHCIQVWKSFFNYLEEEGIIEVNPTRRLHKLRQEEHLPKPLSVEEITALLRATPKTFCGIRDATMMLVLLDTGIRRGELLSLAVDDVDLAQGQLCIFGKGRKERLVPFERTVRRALLRYLAVRESRIGRYTQHEDKLWLTNAGTPISRWQFRGRLELYAAKAGVENVHPHRFRHTFSTMYLQAGGSPQMLQRILGHTTPSVTQRYIHISDTDAKDNHRLSSPVESLQGRTAKRRAR